MDDDSAKETASLTLAQWRRRFPDGKVPSETALDVIRQVAAALHTAHIERPCHRDAIPSTIEVREQADGKTTFAVPDLASAAESHGEPGARRYLAPEQWWGGRQNTFTDQYALAVLYVELVTGEVPFRTAFETEDEAVMRTAVCNHHTNLPVDCPGRDVLRRALSKDPRSRYPTCSAFVAALGDPAHAEAHESAGARAEDGGSHAVRRPRPPRRTGSGLLFKLVLLLALLGGGYWAWDSGLVRRLLDAGNEGAARQAAERRKAAAQAEAQAVQRREAQLEMMGEEIVRQRACAEKALKDYQVFLETGGAAALGVRRDALTLKLKNAKRKLLEVESELERARRTERAFGEVRSGACSFDAVLGEIPPDAGIRPVYTNFVAAGQRLQDLAAQYTERHPEVLRQREVFTGARRQFMSGLDAALKQAQSVVQVKSARRDALQDEVSRGDLELAGVLRDLQVAEQRQESLRRANDRESQLLTDLRMREHELRFGAGAPVSTNRTSSAGRGTM